MSHASAYMRKVTNGQTVSGFKPQATWFPVDILGFSASLHTLFALHDDYSYIIYIKLYGVQYSLQ